MKKYFIECKIPGILLAIIIFFTMMPGTALAAGTAAGTANGTVGYYTISISLTSGEFANEQQTSFWELPESGGESIVNVNRNSATSLSISLSAPIKAATSYKIKALSGAFNDGTSTFAPDGVLTVNITTPLPATGTASATAGTKEIIVALTGTGSFNQAQQVSYWTLGGSSATANPITGVTLDATRRQATITLTKNIGASDELTIQAKQNAFVNVGTAPFASPLTVGITPAAASKKQKTRE